MFLRRSDECGTALYRVRPSDVSSNSRDRVPVAERPEGLVPRVSPVRGDLHFYYPKRSQYSCRDRRTAIDYFWAHGKNISRTVTSPGYPSRENLRMWIDEISPEMREVPIQSGPSATLSDEDKRAAVVELRAREKSTAAVAEAIGVGRISLYKWKNELLGTDRKPRVNDRKRNDSTEDQEDL